MLLGTAEQLGISFRVQEDGEMKIVVFNSAGEYVATLFDQTVSNQQVYSVVWNQTNAKGEMVSSNVYVLRVVAPGFTRNYKIAVQR